MSTARLTAPTEAPEALVTRHRTARTLFAGVAAYALFFAVAPRLAWAFPFEAMFYGDASPTALNDPEAMRLLAFAFSLIGAVMFGWFATLTMMVGRLTSAAWRAVGAGIVVWFVVDGIASVAHGYWQNVLTNAGFAMLLGLAWWLARPAEA